jgi:hypothetical protein
MQKRVLLHIVHYKKSTMNINFTGDQDLFKGIVERYLRI